MLDYERHNPSEVRAAIEAQAIVGAAPSSVISALGGVRLAGGDTLVVGSYVEDGDRRVVEASLVGAKKTGRLLWSVDVVVYFDSNRKATKIDVEYSSTNPM